MGQSWTAIIGALRADRSGRSVHARPRPTCLVASNARAAPRTNQASGRACEYSVSHEGPSDRHKSSLRSSTRDDRARRNTRRACRRPAPSVFRPLRFLYTEVYELRRRCCVCSCAPVPRAAEQQKATAPIMIGHRLLGNTLLCMGDFAEGLSHLDRAWALYDPAAHRPLATRFGHDVGAATLTFRPLALRMLGYPKRGLLVAERAIGASRMSDHMPTLMFALVLTGSPIAAGVMRLSITHRRRALLWRRKRCRFTRCSPPPSGVASWLKPAKQLTQSK